MSSRTRQTAGRRPLVAALMAASVAALSVSATAEARMDLPRPTFATPAEGYSSVAPFACAPTLRAGTRSFAELIRVASGYSYGTTRPCNATWGAKKSYHKTGRAVDVSVNWRKANERADGQVLLDWLFEAGAERLRRLGVVEIIWAGKIWTTANDKGRPSPNVATWRTYTGLGCPGGNDTNCHYDHFHFTLSAAGSERSSSWWTAGQGAPQPPRPEAPPAPIVPAARFGGIAAASQQGYWLVERIGGVFSYGDAPFFGSLGGVALAGPTVAIAATPSKRGYWLVATDGGVFSFGDAGFHGSMGGKQLNAPIVAVAATPSGRGYWLTAADGGVFSFGDAGFHGSMGGQTLNKPIVGMAATPSGKGYWLTASDGGVFAFGDAPFAGSLGGTTLKAAVVGMAATPSGRGYWLTAADGGVFAFGDAAFAGSLGGTTLKAAVVGMAATPSGRGYWLIGGDGGVFGFGDATFTGSATEGSLTAALADAKAATDVEGDGAPEALRSEGAPSAVAIAPQAFRVAKARTSTAPVVTYSAPRSARASITVQRVRSRPCKTLGTCSSFVALRGKRSVRAHAGTNRLRFDGRIGGRALSPGSYRVVVALAGSDGGREVVGVDGFVVKR